MPQYPGSGPGTWLLVYKQEFPQSMVAQACALSTRKYRQSGGTQIQDQPGLHSETLSQIQTKPNEQTDQKHKNKFLCTVQVIVFHPSFSTRAGDLCVLSPRALVFCACPPFCATVVRVQLGITGKSHFKVMVHESLWKLIQLALSVAQAVVLI